MVDVERRIESAAEQAVRQRNYRRARERALTRLKNKYPEEYLRLLEEERERDHKEGRTWTSIRGRYDGSTNAAGRPARTSTQGESNQAEYNQGEARDLAGKE